jgi:hypothetical protein
MGGKLRGFHVPPYPQLLSLEGRGENSSGSSQLTPPPSSNGSQNHPCEGGWIDTAGNRRWQSGYSYTLHRTPVRIRKEKERIVVAIYLTGLIIVVVALVIMFALIRSIRI